MKRLPFFILLIAMLAIPIPKIIAQGSWIEVTLPQLEWQTQSLNVRINGDTRNFYQGNISIESYYFTEKSGYFTVRTSTSDGPMEITFNFDGYDEDRWALNSIMVVENETTFQHYINEGTPVAALYGESYQEAAENDLTVFNATDSSGDYVEFTKLTIKPFANQPFAYGIELTQQNPIVITEFDYSGEIVILGANYRNEDGAIITQDSNIVYTWVIEDQDNAPIQGQPRSRCIEGETENCPMRDFAIDSAAIGTARLTIRVDDQTRSQQQSETYEISIVPKEVTPISECQAADIAPDGGDNRVNLLDYLRLAGSFLQSRDSAEHAEADINNNGQVDLADYLWLAKQFLETCE